MKNRLIFIIIFVILILIFSAKIRESFMEKHPKYIIEIDNSISYNNDIQLNYNNINSSDGGYHVMSRLQTLLYKGNIYNMVAQDSEFTEIYIKNGNKYYYSGQENLNYDPQDGSIRSGRKTDDSLYKTVIKPNSDNIIFTFYKNSVKVNSLKYEYSTELGKNYFGEPIDKKLFTNFSLPKTSKFTPYLSDTKLEILKGKSVDDFKKQSSTYIHEKYAKKLNLNKDELNELKSLELIKSN